MFVLPRFGSCRVVPAVLTVTFAIGLFTRLLNHVPRTVTGRVGATLMPASTAGQPLGPSVLVGQRQDGADAERAVQLLERRRAKPLLTLPQRMTRSVADTDAATRGLNAVSDLSGSVAMFARRQPGRDRRSRNCARRSCASCRPARSASAGASASLR